MTDVRDNLVNQINTTLGADFNAVAVGTDGLSVTADVPGTPFVLAGSTPITGARPDTPSPRSRRPRSRRSPKSAMP